MVVVGVGATAFVAGGSRADDASSGPNTSAASSAQRPRWVTLHLSVSPPEARMTLDGKAIADNPAVLRVPQDELPHELRAAKSGYEPLTRTIRFERSQFLQLTLHRARSEPAVTSVQKSAAAPPPPTRPGSQRAGLQIQAEPEARPSGCDPPSHVSSGVKHREPGCP
jgi:hypothetical protein